jgi:hypothetical protein
MQRTRFAPPLMLVVPEARVGLIDRRTFRHVRRRDTCAFLPDGFTI